MAFKMWYAHIIEYYSAVTRSEVLIYATMWIILENIMLKCWKKPDPKKYILHKCTI
jgi:hypothetical protein